MASSRSRKPVSAARIKTAAVQGTVRQAEADLREANEQLAETVVGAVVTKEAVDAALVQNLHVESQLHEAVKELQVVTDLLKSAEQDKAAHGRSGEGVDSVREHLATSVDQAKDAAP
jgi:hypothetical protein